MERANDHAKKINYSEFVSKSPLQRQIKQWEDGFGAIFQVANYQSLSVLSGEIKKKKKKEKVESGKGVQNYILERRWKEITRKMT